MVERNVVLTIEYDGTDFSGWQRQSLRPSIQAEIERAVQAVIREDVNLIGAGRTDAGVHALGQVANFHATSRIATDRFPPALNAHLPDAIRILSAREGPPGFHSRYAATGRTYRYAVLNRPAPSPILRAHTYHVPAALDLEAMQEGAALLLGTHPFASFRGVGSGERTTVCTVRRADVARAGDTVLFTFEADRFLRHMVRLIVGTLLRVGRAKLPSETMAEILAAQDNRKAGPRAPAHGLFLVRVSY
ncbi:MAG TPA: tRNA pseudouridine(38-40) synthase TruA [bacterium]